MAQFSRLILETNYTKKIQKNQENFSGQELQQYSSDPSTGTSTGLNQMFSGQACVLRMAYRKEARSREARSKTNYE
jgi:hypothetical protein